MMLRKLLGGMAQKDLLLFNLTFPSPYASILENIGEQNERYRNIQGWYLHGRNLL
jgi:hypothetical protein